MKYVSVYPNGDKPNWYIAYPDARTGKRRTAATQFLISEPTSRKKAYDQACELAKLAAVTAPESPSEAWGSWVPQWMETSFTGLTLKRYRDSSWKALRFFFHEKLLTGPKAIRYEHAQMYLQWRTSMKRHRGTYYNYNTALQELRFFGSVMREAVRRGMVQSNPIAQLGLGKRTEKQKPEITEEEDRKIRSELLTWPVWMRECYQVAICQGCRLRETAVPMADVDLARNAITFHGKGGKVFTTQIHPSLRPLAEAKKEVGRSHLVDLPPMPSKAWWKFFREVGLPHLCFHCTKVTVITRLCRAGVPQGVAMSYVNHSKAEVHRIYQRLKLADVSLAVSALAAIPAMPASPDGRGQTPPPSPESYKVRRRTESPDAASSPQSTSASGRSVQRPQSR
jgi:hypothetical protein